jgi:hypothetical protein
MRGIETKSRRATLPQWHTWNAWYLSAESNTARKVITRFLC